MKYSINEECCKKHGLSIEEILGILLLKETDGDINKAINNLIAKEMAVFDDSTSLITPTPHWLDEAEEALLESDKDIPKADRVENLVSEMRELFPKGMKHGSAAWRGNVRELSLRMKKFFKLYGEYSNDDILDATKRYVESFNGSYTFMRILKYFILKSEKRTSEDGEGYVEEVSELANFLENKESESSKEDWRTEIV